MTNTQTVELEYKANERNITISTYTDVVSINKSDPMFWTIEYISSDANYPDTVKVSINKNFIFRLHVYNDSKKSSND
jgi:hypothetical protein